MQIITRHYEVYGFDELSDSAKETAIQKWRHDGPHDEWWDFVYEDAKEIGKILGIDIENIYFSGFSSQGDGAQFVGSYRYEKGSVKGIKGYAPKDEALHKIAERLYLAQKPHFYHLSATMKSSGRYCHEHCTDISVYTDYINHRGFWKDFVGAEVHDEISDTLRDFMRWIYKQLESEYDNLTSDEHISEEFRANDHQFLETGKTFNQ